MVRTRALRRGTATHGSLDNEFVIFASGFCQAAAPTVGCALARYCCQHQLARRLLMPKKLLRAAAREQVGGRDCLRHTTINAQP